MNRADQIIAEIERLKAKYRPSLWSNTDKSDEAGHKIEVLNELMLSLPEEHPSGNLEKAAYDYTYNPTTKTVGKAWLTRDVRLAFIRGAQWQKEQDERLIKLTHDSWYKEGFIYGKIEGLSEDEKYQQGRFDMKEQMMKDAISCEIEWYDGAPIPNFKEEQLCEYLDKHKILIRDKVNVIIVKED